MMHLSDFKKRLEKLDRCNQSIEELEKTQKKDGITILLFFAGFLFAFCILSLYSPIIGVLGMAAIIGVYVAFTLVIMIILYCHRETYILFRKALKMYEKEFFKEE